MLAPFGLEQVMNERFEIRQWRTNVIAIKSWAVVFGTEFFRVLEVLITAEFFASIFIKADVVPEVVALENTVMLHHPPVGF